MEAATTSATPVIIKITPVMKRIFEGALSDLLSTDSEGFSGLT
jgi:hypothetical protein